MLAKMKIRQKFKFTATAAILAFGVGNKGYSQNSSQSVMSVRATVVSGTQFTDNTISDISDQLEVSQERFSMGSYELLMSEETKILVKQSSTVNMTEGQREWQINTNVTKVRDSDEGKVTLHLDGSSLSNIPSGDSTGTHTTSVEFLL